MIIGIEKIECAAEQILLSLNIRTIPVPVEEIASRSGIKISRGPSNEFSGILIRKKDFALIGVNSKDSSTRQRFTIAHELAHFYLHRRKDTFVDYVKYRDNKESVKHSPEERQANMFAAALIMPRKALEKDFKTISRRDFTDDELDDLASKYQVSSDAMRFRLINLRLRAQ
jgi:Zn-dependent peptidase ImmA (M78 family)